MNEQFHVVIIGGGFAGLATAQKLGSKNVRVTLLDRRNVHVFQPLLYQVATGGLSPGDITSPLRGILKRHENIQVLMAEVTDIDIKGKKVVHSLGETSYDHLVIAAGCRKSYFGHDEWAEHAPGLKTIEDALEMRRNLLLAFEAAEAEPDPEKQAAWMTFVIVGGGPTGVELAGALAELARGTLRKNFRHINPSKAKILLMDACDRILEEYSVSLSGRAAQRLEKLGVKVITNGKVIKVSEYEVVIHGADGERTWPTRTVMWAAGVSLSPLATVVQRELGLKENRRGLEVQPDLSLSGHTEVSVVGDLASVTHETYGPVPGVAPAAIQAGRYVARKILRTQSGKPVPPFRYRDKGSLAVIGRNAAVARVGRFELSGPPAWLMWAFVHIHFLIEFDNKVMVLIQWSIDYFTRKRGARFISGEESYKEMI